jgi:hypothetical protein
MRQETIKAKKRKKKKNIRKKRTVRRIPLELNRNYSVPEGAEAANVAPVTMWRAIAGNHLQTCRAGRRRIVSGQQIKDWLDAGGKTSKEGGN